jgi:hypothetical protein
VQATVREPNRCGAATWQQQIVIGRIQGQDFAVRRRLHMFHLAFSSGEGHPSAAFHSIARAQSRVSRAGIQLKTRLTVLRGPSESYRDVILRLVEAG